MDATKEKAALMVARGLTKDKIAEQLGVHKTTIFDWAKVDEFKARVIHYRNLFVKELEDSVQAEVKLLLLNNLPDVVRVAVETSLDANEDVTIRLKGNTLVRQWYGTFYPPIKDNPQQSAQQETLEKAVNLLQNKYGDNND